MPPFFKPWVSALLILALSTGPTHAHAVLWPKMKSRADMMQSARAGLLSLTVLMVINGAELVKKRIFWSKLTRNHINLRELTDISRQVSTDILDRPDVWVGVLGSVTALGFLVQPVAALFQSISQSETARIHFVSNLTQSIVTLVSTAGFFAGQELWQQARRGLQDPEHYRLSERMSALLPALFDQSQDSAPVRAVVYEIQKNMFSILFKDADQRHRFFYNTWRKRLANGRFLAELSFVIGSALIARKALPLQTRLLASVLGVAGGSFLSLYFSEDIQYQVSDAVNWSRRMWNNVQFDSCKLDLAEVMNSVSGDQRLERLQLRAAFTRCNRAKSELVDIDIEAIYYRYQRLNRLLSDRRLAFASNNPRILPQVDSRIESARYGIYSAIQNIRDIYSESIDFLTRTRESARNFPMTELFSCEIRREQHVLGLLNVVLASLEPRLDKNSYAGLESEMLEKLFEEGFNEDTFLEELMGAPTDPRCLEAER